MIARFTRYQFDASQAQDVDRVVEPFRAMVREQPGFQSATWLRREGEFAVFTTWDTREHAEAVSTAVRDKATGALEEASVRLSQSPETLIFEVDES